MCTDSDRYSIEFRDPSLTPQQKAALLASTLLTDMMFFELDNGMCQFQGNALKFTFFLCYCWGCMVPCSCTLQGGQGGDGGGG